MRRRPSRRMECPSHRVGQHAWHTVAHDVRLGLREHRLAVRLAVLVSEAGRLQRATLTVRVVDTAATGKFSRSRALGPTSLADATVHRT